MDHLPVLYVIHHAIPGPGGCDGSGCSSQKEELEFAGLRDLNNDGSAGDYRRSLHDAGMGDHLPTYDPIHVLTLRQPGPVAKLPTPLSRTYNVQHYYGWVGPQCSEE